VTITKLVHSCVLIESGGRRTLVDPGSFTWNDERFDLSVVEGIDTILITHEHADHVNVDFVRGALERSNEATIETTTALAAILGDHGIQATSEGPSRFVAPHERIPSGPGPENVGFHIAGSISHPGDSHSFSETMPVLLMPFVAPWGSLVGGLDRTRIVSPRFVIPIHDWFVSPDGRGFLYGLARAALEDDDIELIVIDDFTSVSLSVEGHRARSR
jgi:L-ascorbate metabolism protein UlaG (beta-lactamase superfamily)